MKPLRDVGRNSIIILIVTLMAAFLIAAASDLDDLESGGTLTYSWLNTLKDAVITLEEAIITSYGTGVETALGVAVGSAGAPVLYDGAGGTPSAIDLTNATNIPDIVDIQNGASPTADDPGEIAHDTTANQVIVDDTVFDPRFEQCVVFENLAAADDNYEIWEFQRGVTLTYVSAHCRGTCTTEATIGFEDRGGNSLTLDSTLTASTGTGNSTPIAVTAGGAFVAGEGMAIDVTNAVSPETDEYTICFMGTVTRE